MPVVENHNDAAVVYTPATSSEHSWLDCTSPFFDVGDIFYLKWFKHPLLSIVNFIDVFGPNQGGIPSPVKHFPEAMFFC